MAQARHAERTAEAPVICEAQFNYLGPQEGKPLYHTSDQTRSRMNIQGHMHAVRDARALVAPSLDGAGFTLVQQKLPKIDYRDPEALDGPYLKEMQRFLKQALGADRLICDTPITRIPGPDAFQKPATRVHTDFTPGSARQLLLECWDQELPREEGLKETANLVAQSLDAPAGKQRYSRVLGVNVWRPISQPPHDYPLALCARDSLREEDVRVADFIEEQKEGYSYTGELSLCAYSPRHEWYCYKDMTPDEVLLFLGFDFSEPGRPGVMHSAFADPTCPKGAPGRSSVEVRVYAFFE